MVEVRPAGAECFFLYKEDKNKRKKSKKTAIRMSGTSTDTFQFNTVAVGHTVCGNVDYFGY